MLKKKVLFLQLTFDTISPRNIRSLNIIKHLKNNYDITIFTFNTPSKKHKIEGVKIIRFEFSFLSRYILNRNFAGFYPKGILKVLCRGLNFVLKKLFFPDSFLAEHKNIIRALKEKETMFDFIYASIFPFSNGILALELKKNLYPRAKVIFDIGDPFAYNEPIDQVNLLRNIKFESNLLHQSDKIIVTNTGTKNHYNEKYNLDHKKIVVVPQGVDVDLFSNKNNQNVNYKTLKLVYAGIFYPKLRDPSVFVQSINELNSPDIRIRFFGVIGDLGFNSELTQIDINSTIPQNELVVNYAWANVLLFFDNAFGMHTSGKIFELLALKKPILFIYSNNDSPLLLSLRKYNHIIYAKNNKESIKEKISMILSGELVFEYNYTNRVFSWESRANTIQEKCLN